MKGDLDLAAPRSKGYFVPMADLLTGLVFILIILLTAAQITDRPEFGADRERENQRRAIQADIQRLNALAEQRLRPAERVEDQFRLFVTRLQSVLSERGVRSEADLARGLVTIEEGALLEGASDGDRQRRPIGTSVTGPVPTKVVADALLQLLTCAQPDATSRECEGLREVKHRRVIVAVAPKAGGTIAEASAAALLLTARLIDHQPTLAALRDGQGRQILEAHGVRLVPGNVIALAFDVERPVLPNGAWLLKDSP
jgi:hypothetical protein